MNLFNMQYILALIFPLFSMQCLAQISQPKEKIYISVDYPAEFKGRIKNFLEKNLVMPECANEHSMFGTIILKFVVTKIGGVERIAVDESSPQKVFCLVNVFTKVIEKTNNKWKPATFKGKKVNSWHTQSFTVCGGEEQ